MKHTKTYSRFEDLKQRGVVSSRSVDQVAEAVRVPDRETGRSQHEDLRRPRSRGMDRVVPGR